MAALYGAGGSVIGPRVAERRGVAFLDREIPLAAAKHAGVPDEAVDDVDHDEPRSGLDRLVATFSRAATTAGGTGGSEERLDLQERRLRGYIEQFLAQSAVSGGVTIGRGGMVVLRSVPWALHVYLGGPREARLRQRMALEGIDRPTAERRQRAEDRTRIDYVRRAYGIDGTDPSHYHLMLDSTALALDTCVDLVVQAALARTREPKASPPT